MSENIRKGDILWYPAPTGLSHPVLFMVEVLEDHDGGELLHTSLGRMSYWAFFRDPGAARRAIDEVLALNLGKAEQALVKARQRHEATITVCDTRARGGGRV